MPPRWWRSVGFRLGAWYAAILGAVVLAGALGARWVMQRSIETEQRLFVNAELERHELRIAQTGRARVGEAISLDAAATAERVFVRIADDDNRTLAYRGAAEESEFDPRDLRPGERQRAIATVGARSGQPWSLTQTRVGERMWLQIGIDDRPRRVMLHHAEQGFWALLGVGALLGLGGGVWLTRRSLAPVRALAATSRAIIASGKLDARVRRPGTGDELDELSGLFNEVLDRNQRLVGGMRDALDNVAHDLRTPLSRLRSGAELALAHEGDAARLRDALADCVEETDRVLVLLRTLMDISEAETGVMQLAREEVDLQALCAGVVDLYRHVAEERQVELTLADGGPVVLRVDRNRIGQAVANLVDNAVKYTDAGGRVTVSVRRDGPAAEVAVADTGIGIEAGQLDKVWQRLYRADPSRNRRGLGLGLSLVRAVVEAHGGSVAAQSELGRGSTFRLRLPGAPVAEARG